MSLLTFSDDRETHLLFGDIPRRWKQSFMRQINCFADFTMINFKSWLMYSVLIATITAINKQKAALINMQ